MPPPSPTICYVAAKSGGHIMPALTLAQCEKSRDAATKILFISSACELDKKILDKASVVDKKLVLPIYGSKKSGLLGSIYTAFNLARSFFESILFFWYEKPHHIVSMGGLISIPVCFAALCMRIPFDMWELNAVPGRAVGLLKSFARTINICFKQSAYALAPWTSCHTLYPVRFNTKLSVNEARQSLNIPLHKKVILILGGSQGSSFMNNDLAAMIMHCYQDDWYIIHQAGLQEYELVKNNYVSKNIAAYVFNFTPDIAACYAAADFVIARAGAGTIFEIAAFKKKALLIPLQAQSTDHQIDNARAITQEYPDLFSCCEQSALTHNKLQEVLAHSLVK